MAYHAFRSKAQWRYCFATQKMHPTWNCRKWAHKLPAPPVVRYHMLPGRLASRPTHSTLRRLG